MAMNKDYLGDGVYAEFDGYQVWLSTLEGHRIALEPAVYIALGRYVDRLREQPSDGTCVRCGAAPRNASGLCATCLDEDAVHAGEIDDGL